MIPSLQQGEPEADATDCVREVRLRPSPARWKDRVGVEIDDEAVRFRRELGLALDGPVFAAGHQAEFWHAGILVKALALDAARRAWNVDVAWLVVDQDANDPLGVRFPVATASDSFETRTWRMGSASTAWVGGARAVTPTRPDTRGAPDFVARGLGRIASAMRATGDAPSLAEQVARAGNRLLEGLIDPPRLVFASAMARTTLFGELVDRMARDPEGCVRSYNEAAARHPDAGVRPLALGPGRVELPLWGLDAGAPRTPVLASDLVGVDRARLAPRALLMTGLMRLAGCELFIHGTGGAGPEGESGYEAVTDDWLDRWLGRRPSAPAVLATSTLLLPLTEGPLPCAARATQDIARAHRARHSPALVGDEEGERHRRALVDRIEAAPQGSSRRAELFRELHDWLGEHRRRNAARLEELDRRAEEARRALAGTSVLCDRAWAFPLHPRESLESLKARVNEAFSADASHQ